MKLKILICVLLLISTVFSVCGCVSSNEIEFEGVIYRRISLTKYDRCMTASFLSEKGKENESIYIYDEINGIPVKSIGSQGALQNTAHFFGEKLKRIYFPWSIVSVPVDINWGSNIEYVFSTRVDDIISNYPLVNFVIPKPAHDIATKNNYLGKPFHYGTDNLIPANIAYIFNYQNEPNEGYFFIDLIEETGKLTKPPYDPKRDGYKFAGWYKDAECTNQWNFETDTVTINFDKNGERIYEEIKLYAKWEQNN